LHLAPHAYFELDSIYLVMGWLLAGFMAMFFVERVFRFHQHDTPEMPGDDARHDHAPAHSSTAEHAGHDHPQRPARRVGWAAALVGLTLHSLLDGVALAAATFSESPGDEHAGLPGVAVFLVVVLHKPFDSLTLGTLMAVEGCEPSRKRLVNVCYALAVPAGAALFQLGSGGLGFGHGAFVGCSLAVAAGAFLCIATSDLLPELHFHSHDRIKLSLALVAGITLAVAIVLIESSGHGH
jgi:zinc and cadmium transporter